MGAFSGGLGAQAALCDVNALFDHPLRFIGSDELIEKLQVDVLKTLPFKQAPFLVPSLKQIPLVLPDSILNGCEILHGDIFTRHVQHQIPRILEVCDVKMKISIGIEMDPLLLNMDERLFMFVCGGWERVLKLPDGLAKIFLGLGGGVRMPEKFA